MSNTFNAVEHQIKIFEEMQEVIAKDTEILSDEERRELEDYVDNQRRQCELYLKLKPAVTVSPLPPLPPKVEGKPKKKAKPKTKTESAVEAVPEEVKPVETPPEQELFTEDTKAQEAEIDLDDLLG